MEGDKGGRAPLSQSQVLERAMVSWAFNKNPCFSSQTLPPVLLGSHDTGGSAAGHLTPPAAVDVDHNDVTPNRRSPPHCQRNEILSEHT